MKPILRTGSMCIALVVALSLLALVTGTWAQESGDAEKEEGAKKAGGMEMPRDTLLAAARDMIAEAHYCALITLDASGHPRARTMDAYPPDENMVIWMGTSRLTRKVKEIRNDPRVTLYFAHPKHIGYVTVYGTAEIVDTPEAKDKWWKEELAQYFPEGKEGFILIAVTPKWLEVTDYTRGITGDEKTWQPPKVKF